jgi:hypothetical protein
MSSPSNLKTAALARVAQPLRARGDRVEDGWTSVGELLMHAEDVPGGRLLLERLGEVGFLFCSSSAAARSRRRSPPWSAKVFHQRNLTVREWEHLVPPDEDHSNSSSARSMGSRAGSGTEVAPPVGEIRVGQNVMNMNATSLEGGAPRGATPAELDRILLNIAASSPVKLR